MMETRRATLLKAQVAIRTRIKSGLSFGGDSENCGGIGSVNVTGDAGDELETSHRRKPGFSGRVSN